MLPSIARVDSASYLRDEDLMLRSSAQPVKEGYVKDHGETLGPKPLKHKCLSTSSPMRPTITTPKVTENGATIVSHHSKLGNCVARLVYPGEFEAEKHFYPRVLNANIHPMVTSFMTLGNERILKRYVHLNPQVSEQKLRELFSYSPTYFKWAGSDIFHVTTTDGRRQMIVVETNSCPSGQKSMPLLSELGGENDFGGYGTVMGETFKQMIESADRSLGDVAVVYDKNPMEASGYAAVLAEQLKEPVWLVEWYDGDNSAPVRFEDGVMFVRNEIGEWKSIRAAFRYVTQKPWNRIPLVTKTRVLNSIVSCLAGGRNKLVANKAYEYLNAELDGTGLMICVPETICNVSRNEIPYLIERMGGHGVVKVPYSNAGQGVFTITNKRELDDLLSHQHCYDKYIVQSLVGNASWSSSTQRGKFYHVGTVPDKKNQSYVCDLRMMVTANEHGFKPVAIYARRARKPLMAKLSESLGASSWEQLGTNLSVKVSGDWASETNRLLLMDRKDFNILGLGIDDLIDAYVQAVLSAIAIDKMCQRLMHPLYALSSQSDTAVNAPIPNDVVEQASPSEVLQGTQTAIANAYIKAVASPTVVERFTEQGSAVGIDAKKLSQALDSPSFQKPPNKTLTHRFDFELFEALNPDKALLKEIRAASGGEKIAAFCT